MGLNAINLLASRKQISASRSVEDAARGGNDIGVMVRRRPSHEHERRAMHLPVKCVSQPSWNEKGIANSLRDGMAVGDVELTSSVKHALQRLSRVVVT